MEEARLRLMVARLRTRETLVELRTEIKTGIIQRTDWRVWFRTHPGPFLLGAFVAGLLLARRR